MEHVTGKVIKLDHSRSKRRHRPTDPTYFYVLELWDESIYVGTAAHVGVCLARHMDGWGRPAIRAQGVKHVVCTALMPDKRAARHIRDLFWHAIWDGEPLPWHRLQQMALWVDHLGGE